METFYSLQILAVTATLLLQLPLKMNIFVRGSDTANDSFVETWAVAAGDENGTLHIPMVTDEPNKDQSVNTTPSSYLRPAAQTKIMAIAARDNTMATAPTVVTEKARMDERIHDRCSASLYSCRNRCNTAPRLACSCHVTCNVYGNCCEDFEEVCPDLVVSQQQQKYRHFLNADVQCFENNFLITSCMRESIPEFRTANVAVDGVDWTHRFDAMDVDDIISSCQQQEFGVPEYHAPATDRRTRLHFKNVFCAVCNGVLDIELWHGLTRCNHGDTVNAATHSGVALRLDHNGTVSHNVNRTILHDVSIDQILTSDECKTFWRPKSDSKESNNPCLHEADTISTNLHHSGGLGMLRSHTTVTEVHKTITEKYFSLNLDWRNVSGEFGSELNQSFFQEKCESLTSFVEHPVDSSSRYKNKYCFMLDSQTPATQKFCEPSLAISDDNGGEWFTLALKETTIGGYNRSGSGIDPWQDWVVYEGIEQPFLNDLVDDSDLKPCDGKTALVYEGKCRSKSFYLTMKTNFTFIRSSLIRGDYNAHVEKFTDLLVETFVDKVSNRTACVVVTYEHNKVPGSSDKFQNNAEFQCLDIYTEEEEEGKEEKSGTISGENGTMATPASLVHGGSVTDNDVNHYIVFVTNTLKILVGKEEAVTLPVIIEMAPCIFPDKDADGEVRGYCTKVKNVWRAARKVDTLVGGLSLEGMLTIICCILSIFGLVIRIALQNVVPFYKSYPGKIQFGLCLSLFLAYALFMLGGLVAEGTKTCTVLAVFTHVAFLSSLFWMNVTAFEIWRTFRTWRNQVVSRGHVSLILSALYAVGIPLLITMTALLVEEFIPYSQFSPSYGEHDCWLNGSMAVAFYFVTPCCIICCINAIFVGLTLRSLRRQRTNISEFKKSNATTAVTDVGIVIKIILLVGITWLLGLLAALIDNEGLWILFTVINASLGFMISVVLVLNKRVYYTVRAKCLCSSSETISVVSTQVQRH